MTPQSRTVAGFADGILVFFPALSLAGALRLPRSERAGEIVSAVSRAGFEPLTNYVQFGLCALLVWGAFALGYRRGISLLQATASLVPERMRRSPGVHVLITMLAAAALVVFVINIASSTVTGQISDGFHEGESLGFVPMFAGGLPALSSALTVHGPGVDFLPAFITARFGDGVDGIALTRSAYATLRSLAVIASLVVLVLLIPLLAPEAGARRRAAGVAIAFMLLAAVLRIGAWPNELALHKTLNARDAGYLAQIVIVLAFAARRTKSPRGRWAGLAAAVAAGASLVLAVVYSYDRGLYGVAFLSLVSVTFAIGGWGRTWFAGLALGAAAGASIFYFAAGSQGVASLAGQVAFWISNGRQIWSYPGLLSHMDAWTIVLLGGALVTLACATLRVLRATARGARVAIRSEIGILIMLAASLPPLRMAIERADASHVAWAVTPAWILACALVAILALDVASDVSPDDPLAQAAPPSPASVVAIALSALVGMSLPMLDPVAAYRHIDRQYFTGLRTADRVLTSPDQIAAVEAMSTAVQSRPCFYTLTNEGTWYYLFRRPSCSPYYQVTNARTAKAQQEVVQSLREAAPEIVLFGSAGWSNVVDGVSLFNANPAVAAYVMSNYVPDRVAGGSWFWRRSATPPRFSERRVGTVVDAPKVSGRTFDARIAGTHPGRDAALRPAALFLTVGSDRAPIWAARPGADEWESGRWSVSVPTAALAKGTNVLQAWAYFDSTQPMVQLGGDIVVKIE